MPEYLAPGVYIEETSYRAKSIEGVATSTTGFVGPTRWGPTRGPARLVTSMEEFQRIYGDLDELSFQGKAPTTNQLAFAARAFFENGGRRLYVARVFSPRTDDDNGVALAPVPDTEASFAARYPGDAGEGLKVEVTEQRSLNLLRGKKGTPSFSPTLRTGDLVELGTASNLVKLYVERDADGNVTLRKEDGAAYELAESAAENEEDAPQLVRVTLSVKVSSKGRVDTIAGLSTHPDADAYIGAVLRQDDPPDAAGRVVFTPKPKYEAKDCIALWSALIKETFQLQNGNDGKLPGSGDYEGMIGTEITSGKTAAGLAALAEVEDIAIVAAPGSGDLDDAEAIRGLLLSHCQGLRYRFAVLSAGRETTTTEEIRELRSTHDSSYGALYYPWVRVPDPFGDAASRLDLAPEGFVAGIYARSDNERGVHKAPANEVVRGALEFTVPISFGTQEVLNPEGINCLRFFEGRGNRVWGARTLSSDPEWKYVNVRRLFIYLEHSIDRAIQWAVFEPNNEALWKKVTMTIESFLVDTWRTGALMGTSPKEAFFVRCDRTTMTQGDLDNGRLVCMIGVAPTKPAEFVIFRIGQWTADASIL